MTTGPDRDDLDEVLRRAAREATDGHQRSVSRDETERALQSTRASSGGVVAPRGRRRRIAGLSAAAAASVALVGALVVVGGARETSVSDDPATVATAAPTVVPSTAVATTSPTSVAPPVAPTPAVAYDISGDPLVGFGPGDGSDGERTAFGDVLYDHLVNRSDILGDSAEERRSQLEEAGLRIHTTFDPEAQAAAEAASEVLPVNSAGIDSAIVSLDTRSGAVRALVGAPGEQTAGGHANMTVAPRDPASASGAFVLAAVVEAGVVADDIIDTTSPCSFPSDDAGGEPVEIYSVNGGITSIRQTTARALSCGVERLSRVIGVDSVVDTMHRMAASDHLDPTARGPVDPFADPAGFLSVSSWHLSPLDMASGMQTIANQGVHHEPYFVEYIDDADGNRLYTHRRDDGRVLGAESSLETIDILRDVVDGGTGRRAALDDDRPSIGVTGTVPENTDAWFVGATPELTTAVWVGDPSAATSMRAIPELTAAGYGPRVQGGHFPAVIWKEFTDATLAGTPSTDWVRPTTPNRAPVRIVLPGLECRAGDDPTAGPGQIEVQQPVTSVDIATPIVPCG